MTNDDVNVKWKNLILEFKSKFGEDVDMYGILLIIGLQELGKKKDFLSKEDKMDLFHIAMCKVLNYFGFYNLQGYDENGWPIWNRTDKIMNLNQTEQASLIKEGIVKYFEELNNNVENAY